MPDGTSQVLQLIDSVESVKNMPDEVSQILQAIDSIGSVVLGLAGIAISIYVRRLSRHWAQRVSWNLRTRLIPVDGKRRLCEVTVVVQNNGKKRLDIPKLSLNVKTLSLEDIAEGQIGYSEFFNAEVVKEQNMILDRGGAFVEPGVTENLTTLFLLPSEHRVFLLHAKFRYPSSERAQETNIRRVIRVSSSASA